jgi:hypothetical protein
MPKKTQEKAEARALRCEGESIKVIAKKLEVSPSSVSIWCRDIILTKAQKARLDKRISLFSQNNPNQKQATKAMAEKYREVRRQAQSNGREKAKQNDDLHKTGCLLYWAEGGKNRKQLQFCNTDVDMMCLFMDFLRVCYSVPDNKVWINLNVHLDNGLTIKDVEKYWLEKLNLPRSCLRAHTVKRNTTSRKAKHPYGVCRISVGDVTIVQSIYGAIQEYFGIERPEWLDLPNG